MMMMKWSVDIETSVFYGVSFSLQIQCRSTLCVVRWSHSWLWHWKLAALKAVRASDGPASGWSAKWTGNVLRMLTVFSSIVSIANVSLISNTQLYTHFFGGWLITIFLIDESNIQLCFQLEEIYSEVLCAILHAIGDSELTEGSEDILNYVRNCFHLETEKHLELLEAVRQRSVNYLYKKIYKTVGYFFTQSNLFDWLSLS